MKHLSPIHLLLLCCFSLAVQTAHAQYIAPYKIPNAATEDATDSLWFLFPDIEAANTYPSVSAGPLNAPRLLQKGDSICLDSGYRLNLIILSVQWQDSTTATLTATMPDRQNALLTLNYRLFDGDWMISGHTRHEAFSCDQLNIQMARKGYLVLGLSMGSNCE